MPESAKKKKADAGTAAGSKPKKTGKPSAAKARPKAAGKPKATGKAASAKPKAAGTAAKAKPKAAGKAVHGKTQGKSGTGAAKPRKPAAKRTPAKKPTSASAASTRKGAATKSASRKKGSRRVEANPVASAANRRSGADRRQSAADDLFLERKSRPQKPAGNGSGTPPGKKAPFNALNLCLAMAIALLIALGARLQVAYGEFLSMREVVDQQTFYEGTTVEGVDVSKMTLSNAMDYWRDRVEARNANRAAVLDNGMTVTAQELGYTSDYESVLSAAWSAGRNGSLEQRYRMASSRRENPAAYSITRVDYDEKLVDRFVELVALKVDQPAVDAEVADFNAETYEFSFTESRQGSKLDTAALKRSVEEAISAGGGNVALSIETLEPQVSTAQVSQHYGLIDYAITNASSSSRARLNNIKLALSIINGTRVASGETFSFNDTVGQRTVARGFKKATAYSGGDITEQVGGGICQVSTTLFNAAVKADMEIVERHNHSLTVGYVDKGKDATVDWEHQDFRFTNTSEDDVFICCYLTQDKRVRFGIFGRLLPNGEKITLEGVTTEVIKYKTEYQPSSLLGPGETSILQNGRNGYKAEAYKIRWDAQGNQLSKELLCKSVYKMKNEIIQYGT